MNRRCVSCSVRMSSIMSELSPEELKEVDRLLVRREVETGDIIFKEGDKMHGCYIIEEGRVKLF